MVRFVEERTWIRLYKMREFAFRLICLYSGIMTLFVLVMLYQSDHHSTHADIGNELSIKVRRFWSNVGIMGDDDDENDDLPYLDDDEDDDDVTPVLPTTPLPRKSGYYFLDTNETFIKRCRSCSLVSSAGHLLGSGAGVDIDSADCVLRMNTAPVINWQEDVGFRTDIRIIGHVNLPRGLVRFESLEKEILANNQTRSKYIVVPWLYQEKVNMSNHYVVDVARKFQKKYPDVGFVFLTEEKHEESEARYKLETGYSRAEMRTWFSTGFVSMMFALDVCDEVKVYGLSNKDFCKQHPKSTVPYHYYEAKGKTECAYEKKNEMDLTKGHKFMTERAMMARWSLVYNVTFHYPSWKATIQNATANLDTPFLRKYTEALKSGKLKDVPMEIIKNGKRFRVVRKPVVRKREEDQGKVLNETVVRTNSTSKKRKIVRRIVRRKVVKPKPKPKK